MNDKAYKGLIEANHEQFCLCLEKLNAAEFSLAAAIRDRDRALAFEVTDEQREKVIDRVTRDYSTAEESDVEELIDAVLAALKEGM